MFGCDAYVHVPKGQQTKLDPKSKKHIFVRYNPVSTGYRLYDLDIDSIVLSRDVVFDKTPISKGASSSLDFTLLGDPTDKYSLPPPKVAGSSGNDNDLSRDIPNVVKPSILEDPSHTVGIPDRLPLLWAR